MNIEKQIILLREELRKHNHNYYVLDNAVYQFIKWLQLGLHSKPTGILNVNHFYDDLLLMQEKWLGNVLSVANFELLIPDDNIDLLVSKRKILKTHSN